MPDPRPLTQAPDDMLSAGPVTLGHSSTQRTREAAVIKVIVFTLNIHSQTDTCTFTHRFTHTCTCKHTHVHTKHTHTI